MRVSKLALRASCGRRLAGWSCAAIAVVALSGCADFGVRRDSYTCPTATTIPELQTLVRLAPGPNGATVQSSGRVNTVTASCDPEGDNGVVSTVDIEFAGLRTTPAIRQLTLPYFVAMADANGNVLGKQQFQIALNFDANAPVTKATDSVTVHMPLKNAQLGNIYTLVVGFQLDRSQVDYNRAHLQ